MFVHILQLRGRQKAALVTTLLFYPAVAASIAADGILPSQL